MSINSIAFTDNDNKLSIGSYDPSHLSSFGGPSQMFGMGAKNTLPMEIGKIRMSLLNFAGN